MWLDLPSAHVSRSVEHNVHTTVSFPSPLSEFEELQTLRFTKTIIILDEIRRSFLTKSATAAMFTTVRMNLGRPPLSSFSTTSLPTLNQEYHLKMFDFSESHSHKPFTPILLFLSQIDRFWNKTLWQISVNFRHPWRVNKTGLKKVITGTLSKISKRNSVCDRMLVDS